MAAHGIFMPRLGMTMEEGTVVAWPIAIGGSVTRGEIVLVIESEKSEVEIEAAESGFMRHVWVEPGETVVCGTLLGALTDTANEDFDPDALSRAHPAPEATSPAAPEAPAKPRAQTPTRATQATTERAAPVAPAARALAKKMGLDTSRITGSGPGGRVVKKDVERVVEARERCVEVEEGLALEVLREGDGAPVVLLAGYGSDVSSFAMQWPKLVEEFELIGIHPPGVGYSDQEASATGSVAISAERVLRVLDVLGLEKVHIVGASLGAAVALEAAWLAPQRVRSLALITPFVTATARLLAVVEAWGRVSGEASRETLAHFLIPWLFSSDHLADPSRRERLVRGLAAGLERVSQDALIQGANALAEWSGSRADDLAGVAVPTLVLAGGDDLMAPHGEQVAAEIPGAAFRCFPGAGHALAIEAAAEVHSALQAHFQDHAT